MCKRGDIYYADFGVKSGSGEQGGIRPAVVVSNNKANANSPVITVVPLTTKIWKKPYLPTHVQIPYSVTTGLHRKSMALAEQVETIDKKKLTEKIGEISDTLLMDQITIALQIQIGAYEEYN